MDDQRDRIWNAYLDGELPASEAAAFDQSLTPEERKRLEGEMAFERACAEALSKDAECPDDVWQRTLESLPNNPAATPTAFPWYWKPVAALAATMLVVISLFAVRVNMAAPEFLELSELNVSTLEATTQLSKPSLADLNAYLEDHNLDVAMMPPKPGIHPVRLLGARESTYHHEQVVEVLLSCCGKPMKVAIVPQGGRAAEAVGKALGDGVVKESRPVGSQLAVLVGRHNSSKLLNYLTDDWQLQTSIVSLD